MFGLSGWTIIRILYSLIFTSTCIYIYNTINILAANKKCPLSEGWRITNGKILSSLLMIVGAINIFIPASKFLSTLPIIGSTYVLLFVLAVFILLFIINRLSINIKEDKKCTLQNKSLIIDFFSNRTILECIYITLIISIIFFYL